MSNSLEVCLIYCCKENVVLRRMFKHKISSPVPTFTENPPNHKLCFCYIMVHKLNCTLVQAVRPIGGVEI